MQISLSVKSPYAWLATLGCRKVSQASPFSSLPPCVYDIFCNGKVYLQSPPSALVKDVLQLGAFHVQIIERLADKKISPGDPDIREG
jgi:hypothetical protein